MEYLTAGIDGVAYVFHVLSTILNLTNPFLFAGATCIWILIYTRVRRELDRAYLRTYALERQVDFLVDHSGADMEFYHFMKKTYEELQDHKRG